MEKDEITVQPKALITISEETSNIKTLIDRHLTEEQERFMTFQYEKKAEIEKIAKNIKGNINDLAKTIQAILDKNHKDYISTFSTFMDTVRKDLKVKWEQMEKIEEDKRQINDVKILRCERDFFRNESFRINNICKELTSKIDDMALRMKILSDEVNSLTIKWRDSESINKQLILELESCTESQKEIEKEMWDMKIMIQNNTLQTKKTWENQRYDSNCKEEEYNEKYLFWIDKLKSDLKQEKLRNNKSMGELNKILQEKSKWESIFIDCVEETRKSIYNRRLRDNLNYKISNWKWNSNSASCIFDLNVNTKYETFWPSDKKTILENFVLNDEVSNLIRDAIFMKPKKEREVMKRTNSMISKVNLPEYEGSCNNRWVNRVDNMRVSFCKTGRLAMKMGHYGLRESNGVKFPMQLKF